MTVRPAIALAACLALAACAAPRWTKPGVSADQAAADYAECRGLAQQTTRRDGAIEADILASRGRDWENTGTLGAHKEIFAAEAYRRSGDVLGACMLAHGYSTKE